MSEANSGEFFRFFAPLCFDVPSSHRDHTGREQVAPRDVHWILNPTHREFPRFFALFALIFTGLFFAATPYL
ncbi:MAG: hypothetical protein V4719_20485 [Planctomycetota bacterium]